MFRKLCGSNMSNNGDQLARRVFGFARIFGNWPFTNKILSTSQINTIKMTVWDGLWLIIIIVLNGGCLYYHIHYAQTLTYRNVSRVGQYIAMWMISIYMVYAVSNILLSIWNRHELLRLILINQKFDKKVKNE